MQAKEQHRWASLLILGAMVLLLVPNVRVHETSSHCEGEKASAIVGPCSMNGENEACKADTKTKQPKSIPYHVRNNRGRNNRAHMKRRKRAMEQDELHVQFTNVVLDRIPFSDQVRNEADANQPCSQMKVNNRGYQEPIDG